MMTIAATGFDRRVLERQEEEEREREERLREKRDRRVSSDLLLGGNAMVGYGKTWVCNVCVSCYCRKLRPPQRMMRKIMIRIWRLQWVSAALEAANSRVLQSMNHIAVATAFQLRTSKHSRCSVRACACPSPCPFVPAARPTCSDGNIQGIEVFQHHWCMNDPVRPGPHSECLTWRLRGSAAAPTPLSRNSETLMALLGCLARAGAVPAGLAGPRTDAPSSLQCAMLVL